MKVIVGFACLLEVMHAKEKNKLPYLLRNIDAHHIMLDEFVCLDVFYLLITLVLSTSLSRISSTQ